MGAASGVNWRYWVNLIPQASHVRVIRGKMESGKGSMKISKVFPDFKKITTQSELRRTLEFTIDRATYRVEVFYCYSNPKSPWVTQAYCEKRSGWKCIPDFPWVGEKNEEAAIRAALSFLQDPH